MADIGPLVLVTRPEPDATTTAMRLREDGYRALSDPVLNIVFNGNLTGHDVENAQALLITSANGARAGAVALSKNSDRSTESIFRMPVFAVGIASADAARAVGFTSVEHAGGDVDGLAALVGARLSADAGPLIHIAGRNIAGDLAGALKLAGFETKRVVLYEAAASSGLAPETTAALSANEVAAALFYSPRSAHIFSELVAAAGIGSALSNVSGVCLSHRVAETLAPLNFSQLRIANRPDETALMVALKDVLEP